MVDKDAVRRGYDDIAATYAAERAQGGDDGSIVGDFLDALPGSVRVLDAGCGDGTAVLGRLPDGHSGVGVDLSREQLGRARTVAPGGLVQSDLTRLPFGDDTFDAVTALHSLIHVPLAEHRPTIGEFARVLRPGGRVLVSEGTDEWCGTNPDWLGTGVGMEWNVAGADATRAQLRDAGFAVVGERTAADSLAEDDEAAWVFFLARLE